MNSEQEQLIGRAIFREANDAFLIVHPLDQRILDVNPAVQRLTGFRRKQLIDLPLASLLEAIEGYDHTEVLRACQTTTYYTARDGYVLKAQAGKIIPVNLTVSRIHIEPEPLALLILRDVTEQKEAEKALRESERFAQHIADVCPAVLYIFDLREQRTVYNNHYVCDALAYTPEQLQSLGDKLIPALMHPEDQERFTYHLASLGHLKDGQRALLEYRLRHNDGQWRWFYSWDTVFRRDAQGAVEQILGAAMDITERKRAEEALLMHQQRLRLLFEQLPAILWSTDSELRITSITGSGLKAIGLTPDELIGMNLAESLQREPSNSLSKEGLLEDSAFLFGSASKGRHETASGAQGPALDGPDFLPAAMHWRALSGKSIEYKAHWKGLDYQVRLEPLLDRAGQAVGCIGIAVDVTERNRAEETRRNLEVQVQHAQKLDSLGVLASGIAHDFNNLLTGILGYTNLALLELGTGNRLHTPSRGFDDDLSVHDRLTNTAEESPVRSLIEEAIKAAYQAADLTEQMLAYSEKGHFVASTLDLSTLAKDMTRLLQVSLSKKCVLQFEVMPDLPPVEGDATQVRQIIMNLVINAADAIGEESGTITVKTNAGHWSREELAALPGASDLAEGLYVSLSVVDTGCGMSEETRKKIFEPFFTTKMTGRGLGLAAVLWIVRGHGGVITCESESGVGTTFTVLFPAATARPKVSKAPTPVGQWRANGKVLVVDDEELVRGLTRKMLEHIGFTVLTAADGREGIELFRQEGEELRFVLLDVAMPQAGAEEFLDEVKGFHRRVPAILMSGYNEQMVMERFTGKGVAAFIQKPYRFEDLVDVVRKGLGEEIISPS
ncbi:MAG: PAS domain S-box protein [Gemmataceae bacterium]